MGEKTTFSNVEFYTQPNISQTQWRHKHISHTPGSKEYFPFNLSQKATNISKTKQTKTTAITTGTISICPRHLPVKSTSDPKHVNTEFK